MARWGCRDCRSQFGAWLSRCPRCGSTKELEMALNACTSCTTKFAVGLPKCPHCGSTEYVEDGSLMAKITRHGGASDGTAPAPEPEVDASAPDAEDASAAEPLDVTEFMAAPAEPAAEKEGGEEPSPGSSSSASTETPQKNSEPSSRELPKRARKTASRSGQARTEGSSAPSTAGDRTDATSATDETAE